MNKLRWMLLGMLAAIMMGTTALAADPAKDVSKECTWEATANAGTLARLRDGNLSTVWKLGEDASLTISMPGDTRVSGLYLEWNAIPGPWNLSVISADGSETTIGYGQDGFINEWVEVPQGAASVTIQCEDSQKSLSIAELRVFGMGDVPKNIQQWQPAPEKAQLMIVAAHPDDEHLYMGGVMPTYSGQQKKDTVVVYMTTPSLTRQREALAGLWVVGVRQYPVFGSFPDRLTTTIEEAKIFWGEEKTLRFLAEQIRRYKPDVIVSHDVKGEYGHGAHRLTANSLLTLMEETMVETKYPDSFNEWGVWTVKKLYLHLYPENKITMDWRQPLSAFNGATAFDMSKAGYDCHVSQHVWSFKVEDTGRYSCSEYGLAYTSVGLDTGISDLFEHVEMVAPTSTPTPTPDLMTSEPTMTPKPVPTITAASSAQPTAQSTPVTGDATSLTLWQRIVAFFRNLFH